MNEDSIATAYRTAFQCAGAWAASLSIWCAAVLDTGESIRALIIALVAFAVAVITIIIRRRSNPGKMELRLIAWALPILFLALLLVLEALV